MYVNASCRRSARCLDVLSFLPFGIMRSYPGFCRRKQLEYNPGLTHRRRAGHPRANRRTSDRPSLFQSTHPLRGATRPGREARARALHFNPRTPCGVRPRRKAAFTASRSFQSTHPLRGATGSTAGGNEKACDFNPRTPCGVRQSAHPSQGRQSEFQSTHPLRGATESSAAEDLPPDFNPRTPCGVRLSRFASATRISEFQSTPPLRGATLRHQITSQGMSISIHAPLAGCDLIAATVCL